MQEKVLRYAFMRLTRELDARFENLLLTGRVAKWYSEVGNEATTVPAGLALQPGDVLCTLHRDLGAILAYYLDPARTFPGFGFERETIDPRSAPEELLYRLACQLLGRHDGFSQGVERSFHYAYQEPEAGLHHIGMISHLGSMIPVAAGCAFALKQRGHDRVAINFIGDGGTSTGDFHEGLNMAAVWRLPLVLVVENNQYAFSTPTRAQFACESLVDRAVGYGIRGVSADGNDPDAMAAVLEEAVLRARLGDGPTLIEARLGRMRGHSEGDDSLKVVPPEELKKYLADDPVPNYAARLEASGVLRPDLRQRLDARIEGLVEAALGAALDSPLAKPETAFREVFAPLRDDSSDVVVVEPDGDADGSETITYVEAIHRGLLAELERDPSVVLLGQDIGHFEGAFRVTRGFHERWPERILDTPIAESGTMGVAEGAAILGYRPVVEMQFGDFVSCGFNQIVNVAAKLYYRWEIPCPLVVRLPVGGGVGAGPFHSQNPEGWFTHTGGLKVVCPATVDDAKGLLQAAIRDPNPVIFCENKYLYRRVKATLGSSGAESAPMRLGRAAVRRVGSDLTLIGYGASYWTCEAVAEQLAGEGLLVEVIDLRTLVPFDLETILESVRKTGRVVVVHEALLTGGFGAEIAAQIADAGFAWLDAPVRRVAYPDRPSPYVKSLEAELLPGVEKVLEAVREVMSW